MAVDNFRYPRRYSMYDSERRERTGYLTTFQRTGEEAGSYHDFSDGSYYQYFYVDYTDTSTWTTVLTLANGVKYQFKPRSVLSPGTGQTVVYYDGRVIGEDGTVITSRYSTLVIDRDVDTDPTNVQLLVTYFDTHYQNDNVITHGLPADYVSLDATINVRKKNETGLYPVPNQKYNDREWQAAYSYVGVGMGTAYSDEELDNLLNDLNEHGDGTPITPILPSEDTSEPGGGDDANPDYNPFSDPVDFPGLPTGGSAIESGFIRVYTPSSLQLQSLASVLWGNDFINTIHKIMNDPMEAMITLHSVPFQIVGGGSVNIEVGNFDTEVQAPIVTTQYYTLDCGNISLPEHWASALDYSPYTNVDIFIPFVGVRSLQIDDVMGRVLNLKYNIDILTGSAIAMLKCGDSVLYTYNTQVHTEIPYTMSSYGRLVQSIIGIAGTAIGATAGGAGAIIGGSIGGALGTAMTKHSDVSRGGALGGAVGVMGDFTPYLIIHRPIQSLAGDFASKKGYPSNISATLGSVSGYTVVDKIHLTGIDCTDTERDEIHALLKDGVII